MNRSSDKQETVFELSLSHSHTFIHSYTYTPRAKLILHMLQNSLKAQNTEHHIILNTPTRQDDLRLPRRHIWAFKKGLSDRVNSQLFLWKSSSFTFNSQFRASSPLGKMVQILCLEFHIVFPFIEFHKQRFIYVWFSLNVKEIPVNFKSHCFPNTKVFTWKRGSVTYLQNIKNVSSAFLANLFREIHCFYYITVSLYFLKPLLERKYDYVDQLSCLRVSSAIQR